MRGKKKLRNHQRATDSSKPLPAEKKTLNLLKPGAVIMKNSPSQDSNRSKEQKGRRKVSQKKKRNKKKAAGSLQPSLTPNPLKPGAIVLETSSTHGSAKESQAILPSQTACEYEKKDTGLGQKSDANGRRNERRGHADKNEKKKLSNRNEEERRGEKNKLGGVIFMCNTKTKPDCFRYRVMAVPAGKREQVMSVRPGLKLFLFDFDRKLLYGIYEATSAGGMKLEPDAFGGAFPAQVRFRIHNDCLPLAESVFKKAITENYDERTHKFKTELTVKQVKKLSSLFCPLDHPKTTEHPVVQQAMPPPKASAPPINVGPSEISYNTKPFFLSEKEYRSYVSRPETYGHQQASPLLDVPPLEFHQSSRERELLLRNPTPSYLDTASIPNDTTSSERLFLSEKEYRMYGLRPQREPTTLIPPTTQPTLGITSNEDRYRLYSYTGTTIPTTSDPYLQLTGRRTIPADPYIRDMGREAHRPEPLLPEHGNNYHLPVRAPSERLPYADHSLVQPSQYNPRSLLGSQADYAAAPVSSRYSFHGAPYR